MRIAAELNLKGKVRLVETYLAILSTKSYRLLSDGNRELLQDYGNPTLASVSSPLLFSLVRLDQQGRVVEDIDVDRPLIEQEAYRRLYKYDEVGRLVETADYDEQDQLMITWRNVFDVNGKKVSEEGWSPNGQLWSRSQFDEHENLVHMTWFTGDGVSEREQKCKYEYSGEGSVTEQIFYPPEEPLRGFISSVSFYTPFEASDHSRESPPTAHRTVFIRRKDGSLRETVQYWPDGSLHERKLYDDNGIMREKSWSLGASDTTTTMFDQLGREIEIRQVIPAGLGSPREVNDVTNFNYDEQGNLLEMKTTGPDGILVSRTSNSYVYDEKGNWIERTEVELNQTWQTEPFAASFETIRQFTRTVEYFGT